MNFQEDLLKARALRRPLGAAALALTLAGAGVGSALLAANAQDTAPADTILAAPQAPVIAQEKTTEAERANLRKELDTLLRQQEQLAERINQLRSRLGERGDDRIVMRDADKRAAEAHRKAESARRDAEAALRKAEEALREAERAFPEGERRRSRVFVLPPRPNVPFPPIKSLSPMPRLEFKGMPRAYFFSDGKFRDFSQDKEWDAEMKRWHKEYAEQWQKWAEEWAREWEKRQPEMERRMRDFSERMKRWNQDFETRMRQKREERKKESKEAPKSNGTSSDSETSNASLIEEAL